MFLLVAAHDGQDMHRAGFRRNTITLNILILYLAVCEFQISTWVD